MSDVVDTRVWREVPVHCTACGHGWSLDRRTFARDVVGLACPRCREVLVPAPERHQPPPGRAA